MQQVAGWSETGRVVSLVVVDDHRQDVLAAEHKLFRIATGCHLGLHQSYNPPHFALSPHESKQVERANDASRSHGWLLSTTALLARVFSILSRLITSHTQAFWILRITHLSSTTPLPSVLGCTQPPWHPCILRHPPEAER